MTGHLALRDCDRPFAGRPAPPSMRGVQGARRLPVAVVVVTGFSMLELGAIVEPLAFVTREHPGTLSQVELIGCTSEAPVSASGLPLAAGDTVAGLAARIARGARFAAVFVCCDGSVADAERAPLAGLMRTCHRQKIRLCVSGGATTVLAECGLLRDHRAVAHWKSLGAQREIHPQVQFDDVLFVSAGTLTSCAGESAAFDMTMDFLAASLPADAVAGVRAHFMVGWTRSGADRQPGSVRALADSLPPPLAAVLKVMNDSIEAPLPLRQLCAVAGFRNARSSGCFGGTCPPPPTGFMRHCASTVRAS